MHMPSLARWPTKCLFQLSRLEIIWHPRCRVLDLDTLILNFRRLVIQCNRRCCIPCKKKLWYLLQIHSNARKESECNVPRCRDLKEHSRRLQQQSDSRRRAAVMEMMRRQWAAEVAWTTR